jgi:hypothetical protein
MTGPATGGCTGFSEWYVKSLRKLANKGTNPDNHERHSLAGLTGKNGQSGTGAIIGWRLRYTCDKGRYDLNRGRTIPDGPG